MKIIVVLLDGLGDRSFEVLNHQTPLEAAHTPNLDRLAQLGSNGLFHLGLIGVCLPSETAHFLLFGYSLGEFPGRGLLEASGYGIPFDDPDVLCLAHLSCVRKKDDTFILARKWKELREDPENLARLFDALTPHDIHGVRMILHREGPNEGILQLRGPVSPYITDADPLVTGRPMASVLPLHNNPEPKRAARTAQALRDYLAHCHHVLEHHEINKDRNRAGRPSINFLATNRAGRRKPLESFQERWGLRGLLIGSGAVYRGVAREIGMDFLYHEDHPDPASDLKERIRLALDDPTHDFIHVHCKAPDEAAHKGDPNVKSEVIAAVDMGLEALVGAVESDNGLLAAVTADHSTPCGSQLIHSGEPVPLVIAGRNIRRDRVAAFDEVSAAAGCLGTLRGKELMLMLLNFADRSILKGQRIDSRERPYFPAAYPPFKINDS